MVRHLSLIFGKHFHYYSAVFSLWYFSYSYYMCEISTQLLDVLYFSFLFSFCVVCKVSHGPSPSLMVFPLFLLSLLMNTSKVFLMSFTALLISSIFLLSTVPFCWYCPFHIACSLCFNGSHHPINHRRSPGSSSDNSKIGFTSPQMSLFLMLVSLGTSIFGMPGNFCWLGF